jgi:hypothetical protein
MGRAMWKRRLLGSDAQKDGQIVSYLSQPPMKAEVKAAMRLAIAAIA